MLRSIGMQSVVALRVLVVVSMVWLLRSKLLVQVVCHRWPVYS